MLKHLGWGRRKGPAEEKRMKMKVSSNNGRANAEKIQV